MEKVGVDRPSISLQSSLESQVFWLAGFPVKEPFGQSYVMMRNYTVALQSEEFINTGSNSHRMARASLV